MLNKLIKFSIQNRILIVIAAVFLAGLGLYNFGRLPIDAVPDITNVQVQINTNAEGLSTLQIEKQITFPIETAMSGLPKLEEIRSLSRFGFSQITIVFKDDTDIYWARQLVGERLQQARESIPPELGEPRMGPVSTGLGEIFMWSIKSEKDAKKEDNSLYTLTDLRVIQDWIVRPQLLTVPGVTEVNSIGGFEKQIHIEPYPGKLIAYELTFHDVLEALNKNNTFSGGGYIEHKGEQYIIQANGLVSELETIKQIPLLSKNRVPVYIHDVADIHIGEALRTGAATLNGKEAVIGTAMMLIGENSRTVSSRLTEELKQVNKSLPEGITAEIIYNRANLVNAAVSTVMKNLIEGALLVIVVLFLILGNFRVALFVALSIPLSMLFAIIGMVQYGISGNLLSLGAIDFGIIVDGSVVMAENIIRRFAKMQCSLERKLTKKERLSLAYKSAKEVATPVASGVMIIMIVYLPILTLTGIEGKMFVPMAQVVLLALTGSLILSFTLVPAMIALFLTGEVKEDEGRFMLFVKSFYENALNWTLSKSKSVITCASFFLIFVGFLSMSLGSEFVPSLDEQDIAVQSLRIPATSLSQSVKMQKKIEKAILEIPEIENVFARIGTAEVATDPMPPGIADGYLIVKPRSEWSNPNKSKTSLIKEIEKVVSQFPGNLYEFSQPIELRFNELISGVRSDVAVKIFGDSLEVLQTNAKEIESILKQIEGASDVKVEQSNGLSTLQINVNREQVARYGISISDVQDVVSLAVGGKNAGLFFDGDKRFDIVVRLPESLREKLDVIKNLPISLPVMNSSTAVYKDHNSVYDPNYLPLRLLADIKLVEGLNQVSRENTKRRIVIQANVRDRDMGSFVKEASIKIDNQIKLPSGYWYKWGGQFENLQKAKERLMIVVPVSLLLIFIILFSTFRSIMESLIIFTGVPFALTGGVLALLARDIPFSISAGVGFVALSGVAVLNGVVMISFIKHLHEKGRTLEQAIKEGALVRLRPVLMTALVASLGFIPMAFATSTGAEVQRPLATVVIGGIISSTILTLLVLPTLYKFFGQGQLKVPTSDN